MYCKDEHKEQIVHALKQVFLDQFTCGQYGLTHMSTGNGSGFVYAQPTLNIHWPFNCHNAMLPIIICVGFLRSPALLWPMLFTRFDETPSPIICIQYAVTDSLYYRQPCTSVFVLLFFNLRRKWKWGIPIYENPTILAWVVQPIIPSTIVWHLFSIALYFILKQNIRTN